FNLFVNELDSLIEKSRSQKKSKILFESIYDSNLSDDNTKFIYVKVPTESFQAAYSLDYNDLTNFNETNINTNTTINKTKKQNTTPSDLIIQKKIEYIATLIN